jgi:N6-adenosine-specific RNA methylase IME4
VKTSSFADLVGGDYKVIYADYPWKYAGDPLKDQAAGKHYACMNVADMVAQFPLAKIMAKTSVAFIWATSPLLHDAIDLILSSGLYYRGVARVWVKTTKDGKIIHGQGVRPSIIKPTTEFLLAATKEPPEEAEFLLAASTRRSGRPLPLLTESMGQVVLAPRPSKADGTSIHSAKPAIFRDDLVKLFGDVKRVELFARQEVAGWDCWGNQIASP